MVPGYLSIETYCYIYIKVYQQCLYIKRRSMYSDWASRGAFSMHHTISFIVPSINFMAPSVVSIVLTWFGNIYPAHYSNYHVCYKYRKAKAVQRYGYNAIACCNLKTEAVKTLPLSLYAIFEIYHYNIIQCHNFDDYITLSSFIGSMKLNVSFASNTIVILP